MDRPKIVLGLGNPGARYAATRHNLGFRVVDRLAERARSGFRTLGEPSQAAWVAEVTHRGRSLVLAKPRTYMNRSGHAAVALCRHYATVPSQLLVVYDDADLALGRLRIRPSGSDGGHNGLGSLIETLASESIPRVRMGVRGDNRGDAELADYVLAPFDDDELEIAEALVGLAADAVSSIAADGLTRAMNRYNARSARPDRPANGAGEEE